MSLKKKSLSKQDINKKVFANLGDALYNATFITNESLIQISNLLRLDISAEDFRRQQFTDEMVDQMQYRFGGIISFLRTNFPSASVRRLSVFFILVLGVMCELAIYTKTGKHSWEYVTIWYLFLSLAIYVSSIAYVFTMIRNYFVSSSQQNLLKMINLIERSSPEELKELNHCLYVPLWRKVQWSHPCKFSLKTWIKSGFRGGWTVDQNNIDAFKGSPFQEGLLEVLRLTKLKQHRQRKSSVSLQKSATH